MLARNADVGGSVHAARELEDRFNHKHNYLESFLTSSRPRANSSGAPFPRSIPHESPEERVSLTHNSRVIPRFRTCAFWTDRRGALVPTFVNQRDKGEGRER